KTILQFMEGRRYSPSSATELIQYLAIPDVHHSLFEELLDRLVSEGKLIRKKETYSLPKTQALVTGTISVHPKGFGFVKNKEGPDIFIPRHSLLEAVDGDEVEVEVNPI